MGLLGDAKTCQRVSFGSGRVAAALAGHTPDAAAVSREELFPRSHRREAPEVPLKERGGNAVCPSGLCSPPQSFASNLQPATPTEHVSPQASRTLKRTRAAT